MKPIPTIIFLHMLTLLVPVSMLISSCQTNEERMEIEKIQHEASPAYKILGGTHELRRLKSSVKNQYRASGSYFLIAGGFNASGEQKTVATFSFKMADGNYAIAELPVTKIRVHVDSTITVPYVTFEWGGTWHSQQYSIDRLMEYYVSYMVLHCKEEDYPVDININQL